MVPLTGNIVFGRKIASLCATEAAVGSSFPRTRRKLSTFSTSDSSEPRRHREGYAETPLTTAEPVRPMRRSSSPPSARPPKDAKAFKRTEDSGGASLHPLRQRARTSPSSMSAGLGGENMGCEHQIMFPTTAA